MAHFGRYLVSDYGSEVTLRFGRTLVRSKIGMVIVIGGDRQLDTLTGNGRYAFLDCGISMTAKSRT